MYSHSDVANRPINPGDDFIFIHNPKSKLNAIPNGYFKLGVEYHVRLEHDKFAISWED